MPSIATKTRASARHARTKCTLKTLYPLETWLPMTRPRCLLLTGSPAFPTQACPKATQACPTNSFRAMKRCTQCLMIKELAEFYSDPRRSDGKRSACKRCTLNDCREYGKKNCQKRTKRNRAWRNANAGWDAARKREWRKNNPGAHIPYMKRYREQNPQKIKAREAVRQAIRRGDLSRGICRDCGTAKNVHAHHADYSRPLDVIWLCAVCHGELHAISETA